MRISYLLCSPFRPPSSLCCALGPAINAKYGRRSELPRLRPRSGIVHRKSFEGARFLLGLPYRHRRTYGRLCWLTLSLDHPAACTGRSERKGPLVNRAGTCLSPSLLPAYIEQPAAGQRVVHANSRNVAKCEDSMRCFTLPSPVNRRQYRIWLHDNMQQIDVDTQGSLFMPEDPAQTLQDMKQFSTIYVECTGQRVYKRIHSFAFRGLLHVNDQQRQGFAIIHFFYRGSGTHAILSKLLRRLLA